MRSNANAIISLIYCTEKETQEMKLESVSITESFKNRKHVHIYATHSSKIKNGRMKRTRKGKKKEVGGNNEGQRAEQVRGKRKEE